MLSVTFDHLSFTVESVEAKGGWHHNVSLADMDKFQPGLKAASGAIIRPIFTLSKWFPPSDGSDARHGCLLVSEGGRWGTDDASERVRYPGY